MAITDKEKGVWGLDQVYNKINQGSIWEYSSDQVALWTWGPNFNGVLGLNQAYATYYSSPVQVSGSTWSSNPSNISQQQSSTRTLVKTDGTLWAWGENQYGQVGNNSTIGSGVSSPVQIPGTTWKMAGGGRSKACFAVKTDGTLWSWGSNAYGSLGLNQAGAGPAHEYSSPVQIPGTTWSKVFNTGYGGAAIKTDGTLWVWGMNSRGQLGQNSTRAPVARGISSPTQIPGTTWERVLSNAYYVGAMKTDGTMWAWGDNGRGELGQNNRTQYSSPVQIPGTWSFVDMDSHAIGTKTDGTLWSWGDNTTGQLGHNNTIKYSSPVQIPGTWSTSLWNASAGGNTNGGEATTAAIKADGTLWSWGNNNYGQLGVNDRTNISSPVQVAGSDYLNIQCVYGDYGMMAMSKL